MKTEGYEEEGGLGVGAPGRNAAAVPGMGGRDGEAVAAPAATAGTAMEGGRAVAATAADGGEDDGDQDDEDGLSPEGDGGGAMGRKKKRRLCEDRRFGEIGGRRGRLLGFITFVHGAFTVTRDTSFVLSTCIYCAHTQFLSLLAPPRHIRSEAVRSRRRRDGRQRGSSRGRGRRAQAQGREVRP